MLLIHAGSSIAIQTYMVLKIFQVDRLYGPVSFYSMCSGLNNAFGGLSYCLGECYCPDSLQAVLRTKLRMAKSLVPICDFWHEVILIFWFIS